MTELGIHLKLQISAELGAQWVSSEQGDRLCAPTASSQESISQHLAGAHMGGMGRAAGELTTQK